MHTVTHPDPSNWPPLRFICCDAVASGTSLHNNAASESAKQLPYRENNGHFVSHTEAGPFLVILPGLKQAKIEKKNQWIHMVYT